MLSAATQASPTVQSRDTALPSRDARLAYRSGKVGVTAGVAPGFVQGNLAIVPEALASAFHRFCQLNAKPCPIIGMSEVGDPRIPALGIDLDIRTDCRAIVCGGTGNCPKNPPTSWRTGATILSFSSSAARFRLKRR